MDDDLGRPGRIITTPVAFGRRRAGKEMRPGRKFLREIRAATEDNYGANGGKDWGNLRDFHSEADVSPIVGQCNGQWHLGKYGKRRCTRSNLNAVADLAEGRPTDLLQAWPKVPGLTAPAGGIRSVDGHDY